MQKICFITDLHIDTDDNKPMGIDTKQHFLNILEKAVQHNDYDLIILGGDLCHRTGDESTYKWVYNQISNTGINFLVIPGNHDTSVMLASAFHQSQHIHNDELYFTHQLEHYKALFLDSSLGSFSTQQWLWLRDQIQENGDEVLIFIHHSPIQAHSKHMEPKYMFRQTEKFEALCDMYPEKKFHVVTGHYHIERTVVKKNITVFISPSTFVQIDPNSDEFKPYTSLIGYREICINQKGSFHTEVIYL